MSVQTSAIALLELFPLNSPMLPISIVSSAMHPLLEGYELSTIARLPPGAFQQLLQDSKGFVPRIAGLSFVVSRVDKSARSMQHALHSRAARTAARNKGRTQLSSKTGEPDRIEQLFPCVTRPTGSLFSLHFLTFVISHPVHQRIEAPPVAWIHLT